MAIALDNLIAINSVNAIGGVINTVTLGTTNDSQIEGPNAGTITYGKLIFGTGGPAGAGHTIASGVLNTVTQNEGHLYSWFNGLVWNKGSKATQLFGNAAKTQNTTIAGGVIIRFMDTLSALATLGANQRSYYVTGSDRESYGGWKPYVVDPCMIPNMTTAGSTFNGMWPPGTTTGTGATSLAVMGSIKFLETPLQTITGIGAFYDAAKIVSGFTVTTGTENFSTLFDADSVNNALNTITGDGYPVGIITQSAGIYFQSGRLRVGSPTTIQYTELSDSNQTIVFAEQLARNTFNRYVANGGGTTVAGNSTTVSVVRFGEYDGSSTANGCVLKGAGYFYKPYTATSGTNTITVTFAAVGPAGVLRVGMRVFGPYVGQDNYIIAIPGTQTIQLSSVISTAATSYMYFYWPMYGLWSGWANNNSSSQFKLYGSSVSEVMRLYLSSVSEVRDTSFVNFGGIEKNSAIITGCTFNTVNLLQPVFGTFAISTSSASDFSSITSSTFTNCVVGIQVKGSAGVSVSKSMTGLTFNGALSYISGTLTSGTNQITSASSTAGITYGMPVHHPSAGVRTTVTGVTLTASATATGGNDEIVDLSVAQFNVVPILAGMEVVAGTYGTAVVPPNTFVKRVITDKTIELTNRITGTTATNQSLVFRRGIPFVTGIVGTTIFLSQNSNTTGTYRLPIGYCAIKNSIIPNTPTNGSNSTTNATYSMYTGSILRVAQAFPGNAEKLSSVSFRIARVLAPTGTLVAKLFAITGTYGSSAIPTGTELATSKTIDVSTLGTTAEDIIFMFDYQSGTDYTIASGTDYAVTLEFTSTSSSATNYIAVSYNNTSVVSGNSSLYTVANGWSVTTPVATATHDLVFAVKTNANLLLTNSSPTWPVLSETGGGVTLIGNAVNLTVTVLKPDGTPLQNARVIIWPTASGASAYYIDDYSNVSGIVTTSLVYSTDTPVIVRVRAASKNAGSNPTDNNYIPQETSGTITSTGFSTTVKMVIDPIKT